METRGFSKKKTLGKSEISVNYILHGMMERGNFVFAFHANIVLALQLIPSLGAGLLMCGYTNTVPKFGAPCVVQPSARFSSIWLGSSNLCWDIMHWHPGMCTVTAASWLLGPKIMIQLYRRFQTNLTIFMNKIHNTTIGILGNNTMKWFVRPWNNSSSLLFLSVLKVLLITATARW